MNLIIVHYIVFNVIVTTYYGNQFEYNDKSFHTKNDFDRVDQQPKIFHDIFILLLKLFVILLVNNQ